MSAGGRGAAQEARGWPLNTQTLECSQPPIKGFWSLTLYDEYHFFHSDPLSRYSLGTKNKTLKYNDDGSLTLYAGAKSPGADKESNWLPAPDGKFSLYIRAYWPDKPIIDGSWTSPAVQTVDTGGATVGHQQ